MIGLIGGSLLRGAGGALAKGAGKKLISGGKNKKQGGLARRGTGGQEQGGGSAITVRPKSALIPATSIPARTSTVKPKSTAGVSGKSTLEKIDKEVLTIRKLLGSSVKQEGKEVKAKKKLFEKERRKKAEQKLEKRPPRGGIMSGLNKISPGGGILGAITNFIFSVLAGKFLLFLLDNREAVASIVKGLAAATGFLIDLGGKILDGMVGLLDGAYRITDAIGTEIKSVGGDEAGKEYNKFLGTFNKFINLAMILAMSGVPGNLGGLGGKNVPAGGGKVPKSVKLPGGKPVPLNKFAGFSNKGTSATAKTADYMNRSRIAKTIEKKFGNEAARAYQNAYNNSIQSGKSPTQAAQQAKANVNKLIKKGKITPQAAGGGLGATGGSRATGRTGGVFRRGVGKAGSRLQTRLMGRGARLATNRAGARLASKFARFGSGPLGRIPIIGPLIIGISSYMEDGKLDKALFKAGGSAIGGFLGSFIPIPILGTLIGTLAGEYVGDIFYELLRGGGVSAVGAKLKRDMMKVIDGVTIFKDWLMKGISEIQNYDGGKPKIPGKIKWAGVEIPLQWLGIPKEGFKIGGWASLLNPFDLNVLKKFDILRQSFFKSSMTGGSAGERIDMATGGGNGNTSNDRRGSNDQDDPNSPGGNRPRTITQGGGRMSLPSGSGSITKVPFDDPNFNPGTTRKKDTMIYLHWTAGNYGDASSSYGYHTIFTGDGGIVRNKDYDSRGGHTEGKNSNSVGLSLAAMAGATGVNNFGSQPVTHEQLNQMAAEAARLAVKWNWSEGDIDKNIWTHAEAGSGLDPRGLSGHQDWNGDGKPDNYGMFNRAPNESMHRWDLYTVTEGGEPGSGGPILRDMIKKHYKNFKAELSGKEPSEGDDNPRGDSDQDDPKKSGPKPQPRPKNDLVPYKASTDTSMKDFDPSKYTEGTLNSHRLIIDDKSYYIRYEMDGNDAIVKQVNKRIRGGFMRTEELGSVDPNSEEFKKLLESEEFKDNVAKQTNLELKKVRIHGDIEKYYLYDKSYQQHYRYWLKEYQKGNITFERAKELAASAAKNAAIMDMKKDDKGNTVIDKSGQTTVHTDIDDDVRDRLYADTTPVPPSGGDNTPATALKGVDFSSLGGGGAFSDMFGAARANLGSKGPNFTPVRRSSVIPKRQPSTSSSSPSSSSSSSPFLAPSSDKNIIVPDKLNKDIALKDKADYEEEGQKVIVINQPYIVNNNMGGDQPQSYTSSNVYYS